MIAGLTGLVIKLVAAYLLGSVLGGDVLRWLLGGADLRTSGSGNVGATNALRSRGPWFAAAVLLFDIGKGVAAVLLIPAVHWPQQNVVDAGWLPYLCGVAVVLGHCYPIGAGFRGGKGVATLMGVLAALALPVLPWMIAAFALTVLLTGYVSLATLTGAATVVAWVAFTTPQGLASPLGGFVLLMSVLTVFKHRENIQRLFRGTEHRFERARILGRWLAG
jgi:glycerol-3-phosphate acyltransferase PlsY